MQLWSIERFFYHFCHHFWVGLVLLCTHPKVIICTKVAKKCSTDQSCILKEVTSYKIHTLTGMSALSNTSLLDSRYFWHWSTNKSKFDPPSKHFSSFFWNKACSHWSLWGRSISRDVSNINPAIFKLERNSQFCGKPSTSLQVNLCQKLFFLQNMGRTCCVQKLFWMSETISEHNMFSPGLN